MQTPCVKRMLHKNGNPCFRPLPTTLLLERHGLSQRLHLGGSSGNLLSERSQQAALALAQTCKLQQEDRLKLIGVFICQLPEASLR